MPPEIMPLTYFGPCPKALYMPMPPAIYGTTLAAVPVIVSVSLTSPSSVKKDEENLSARSSKPIERKGSAIMFTDCFLASLKYQSGTTFFPATCSEIILAKFKGAKAIFSEVSISTLPISAIILGSLISALLASSICSGVKEIFLFSKVSLFASSICSGVSFM